MLSLIKLLKSRETKLVVIKVEVSSDCLITSIRIDGDYFASNPELIDGLMKVKLRIDEPEVIETVSEALKKAEVYGMSIPEVLNALKEAVREARAKCVRK